MMHMASGEAPPGTNDNTHPTPNSNNPSTTARDQHPCTAADAAAPSAAQRKQNASDNNAPDVAPARRRSNG